MYTILAFYIIGYAFFVRMNYKDWGEWDGFTIFFPLFQSVFIALAGLFIAVALPVKYETIKWQETIVALKDNNNVNARFFFLGSGIIEGEMKYVYYIQNEDSSYQMWQCDYTDAVIKYVKGQPKVDITDVSHQKCIWNKFALDLNDESHQTYVFEVPKGSIENSYQLDSQ